MMEIILTPIVEMILKPIAKSVARPIGFLLHYKQNLKILEDEMNNFQEERNNIEEKVSEANHHGEAIESNVMVWLKKADEARQVVDEFRDEKSVKENMSCFIVSCPNIISRYRLRKETEKKVVHIKHLTKEGSKINRVSHPREAPLELVLPSSKDYEYFDSRDEVFEGIVGALIKDPKVNMIGVYGTGGVGKTTMVSKIGSLLKEDKTFDEVIMAVVSKEANIKKIQGQLADLLDLKLSGETEVGRAKQLWNRLDNGKKNLIILDDVWQELDLRQIGIPIKDDNKSCKVVLTSRKQAVLKNMGVCKDFKIGILSGEESWALFKNKVENFGDTDEHLAKVVCEECQGLPVAIIALGVALKGKDMDAWQDALYKLQNSMLKDIEGINSQVYASLKWSFDWLDSEDAKSCFLLCCLFPEDGWIPIDELLIYYMAGKSFHHDQKPDSLEIALYRVRTVLATLKSCCLLLDEKHYSYPEHFVKMHDVVRDVAISIAKAEKSFLVKHGFTHWPEKTSYGHCSVMSLRPKNMREFPDELGCPELHTLRLDCGVNEFQSHVPDRFFNATQNLTVLYMIDVTMPPILPASLAKLAKLQMLCLDRCKLEDIAILKNLKDHLEILTLQNSDIKALPPEVGELARLRYLDMDGCKELEVIPAGIISKLCCLEVLYMPSTFGQWEGAIAGTKRDISVVRLDELMSLTRLTTLHIFIPDAALLPEHFTFENLVTFRILVGQKEYIRYDYSTGTLKLKNIHFDINWEGLLQKPKQRMQRSGLYRSKSFCHLGYLCVTDCRLKYLFSPSSARGLVRLKKLKIEDCLDMEGVIGNEGHGDEDITISFSRLNELHLEKLPNLISFYPKKQKTTTSGENTSAHAQMAVFTDMVTFPALETLYIAYVPKVTEIWYMQTLQIPGTKTESSFNQLQSIKIYRCDKLLNVVGGCSNKEPTLESEKQKGKEDDHCVTRFPKLKILELGHLLNLESLCSCSIRCEAQPLFGHQVAFPALERLYIAFVPKVTKIWYKQSFRIPGNEIVDSSFNQLQSLEIRHCDKLVNVVGGYSNEEVTFLSETQKGREDDHCVTQFPKLRILRLEYLSNLESLCSRSVRCEAQPLFDHQEAMMKAALEYTREQDLKENPLRLYY